MELKPDLKGKMMKDMPILERRRIEAQILKHVHEVIEARSGIDEADAVVGAAVSRSAIDQGRGFAETLEFNVLRCRYAEMYREMGLGRIGHLLSCNRDGDFCTGYNPDMKLTRTQTIMGGASHCDFRYRMEPATGANEE